MKTSKIIDLLTTAISGCSEDMQLILGMNHRVSGEFTMIDHQVPENTYNYTHVSSVIGCSSEMVRELYNELPESLKTESLDKQISELYPHLMQKDWDAASTMISKMHGEIYAIWQDMVDAKDKMSVYS